MPALAAGKADFGVFIHEGRFTYHELGLALVEDLGERWESLTETPLPLGGIIARRSLPHDLIAAIQRSIFASLQYAMSHRSETLPTLRAHAQEFSDEVLMAHVDTYVNQWTLELGDVGRNALARLSQLAKENGIVADDHPPLEVFDPVGQTST